MLILKIIEIIVAVLLIVVILLQMQGSGLSSSFGGGGGEFYRSKRSIEKLLVWATVGLAGIFAVISILLLASH
jgi:protein translocase SecG subunit